MPLCNAISARTGRRCRRAAMKGKDLCGIHAGKYKPGAKIYNRPNLKHGLYAEEAMQERMEALDALHLLKDTVETINSRLESAITYKKRGIKMFNSKMVKLDNLFSRNNLGEVRLENPDYPGVWKTDEQDYVTIRVPDSMKDRFKVFWQSAASVLGEKLKVLHVQLTFRTLFMRVQ